MYNTTWTCHENGAGATPTFGRRQRRADQLRSAASAKCRRRTALVWALGLLTWFPATRFRNRVRTCHSVCRCWGVCAAGPGGRPASFPCKRSGGAPGVLATYGTAGTENRTILYERISGNGELAETENVIFYVSYGILTDERNSCVLLQRRYGNGGTDTWLYCVQLGFGCEWILYDSDNVVCSDLSLQRIRRTTAAARRSVCVFVANWKNAATCTTAQHWLFHPVHSTTLC